MLTLTRMKPTHCMHPLFSQCLATATPGPSTPGATPPSNPTFQVFSRNTKRLQRDRSVLNPDSSRRVDYLKDAVAERLVGRLMDIKRTFPTVLDLGAGACHIAKALTNDTLYPTHPPEKKITNLLCTDLSQSLLYRDSNLPPFANPTSPLLPKISRHVLDEEDLSKHFPENHFSAILSSFSLHWVNNLPSLLSQINHLLLPDSPFIAAMLGGDSLFELRTSLQLAEQERRGGVSPRVSPLADVKDMGALLQSAGFKMLTVDVDDILITYPDIFALMTDLQYMGEGNAVLGREMGAVSRDVLMAAEGIYRELYGEEAMPEEIEEIANSGMEVKGGKVLLATFRLIYMIGWSEGPNQPKPLGRGSGEVSIKNILEGGSRGEK
ncbi:S-adenosyl-L-methionine-dependent methyltransferase [Terfezia claveryi]|nr:S-adenosyl-L-methionine-dependent methyltransferase [Terfezia claveryi]